MNTHIRYSFTSVYVCGLTIFLGVSIIAHPSVFGFYKTAGLFGKVHKFLNGKKV